MTDYTGPFNPALLLPPSSYLVEPAPELSESTIATLQQITKHFSDPNLEIRNDETSTEKRKLDQREIMFLVCPPIIDSGARARADLFSQKKQC
jgi:hypothetical protein